jgi:ankyrin repeat protein
MSQTSLIALVKRGDLVELRKAADGGADPEETDSQGWTPLFHAAHIGNLSMVRLLLDAGATVNHGAETGFTALFSTVMGDHIAVVRELLRAGARVRPVREIDQRGYAKSEAVRELLSSS